MVKIIENGFVVSGNVKNQLGCMTVIVQGNRILEIGKRADAVKPQFADAEVIDAAGKIIFPGFINAHYRGESFILRFLTTAVPAARWGKQPPYAQRSIISGPKRPMKSCFPCTASLIFPR